MPEELPEAPDDRVTEAIAELFGLDLDAFIPRRDELVRALRKAGDRHAASAVGALRKPGLHLWVANRLARDRPLAATRLLSAAANVADAQEKALGGDREAGARLRQDSQEYQRALDLAVREAGSLLRMAHRGDSEETLRRVRDVLAGAALGGQDERRALGAGALVGEPAAPVTAGFGAAAPGVVPGAEKRAGKAAPSPEAGTPASARPAPPSRTAVGPGPRRGEVAEARRSLETAGATAKRLVEVARRARRRAAIAAAEAASAEQEAHEAEARAQAAQEEAEAAAEHLRGLTHH